MNGNASNNVTKIARIFGTKISVCSWIWVSAWNSDTTTPTTSPITIRGDDTTTMVQIASRATSRVSAPVISISFFIPHGEEARSAVSHHEARGPSFETPAAPAPQDEDRLTRHPHDVFVGLDHPIAHRHQRRDRDVGLRHRRHHVHHVALAGGHRHGLGVGFL